MRRAASGLAPSRADTLKLLKREDWGGMRIAPLLWRHRGAHQRKRRSRRTA